MALARHLSRCNFSDRRLHQKFDAIIVGAGHNGLVCGAYLSRAGKRVCILERRHIVGGAAVTEEIVPGFQFSRASYVLGVLRPQIAKDLELKRYGLKIYQRNPCSYTPMLPSYWQDGKGRSLTLGSDEKQNFQQISQFSKKDAEAFPKYEALLNKFADAVYVLLDHPPLDLNQWAGSSLIQKIKLLSTLTPLLKAGKILGKDVAQFIELVTGASQPILDRWFESEPLKATLVTDSVIGAMVNSHTSGSGYVLLHHVMAQVENVRGVWGYPEGGMGAVTQAMARSAEAAGAIIRTNAPVKEIMLDSSGGQAIGVETEDGEKLYAPLVFSNATPYTTFLKLLPEGSLPQQYQDSIKHQDYTSPVCKINVALKSLPNFTSDPTTSRNGVMPHHHCTAHFNCERSELLTEAYNEAQQGLLPQRPMLDMVLPSSLDPTLAPKSCHVALLFSQYVPYAPKLFPWDNNSKRAYAQKVFSNIEEYAPGFKDSIIDYEVLTPPDLEKIFGLTGGNIFHGSMSLDKLYSLRPSAAQPGPFTPVSGLMLCGSGAHPGGGVMGAPGRIAALTALGKL